MAFNKPLYEAAGNGKLALCESLILKKANVNWKNPDWVVHSNMKQVLWINNFITLNVQMQVDRVRHSFLVRSLILIVVSWMRALVFSVDFTILFALQGRLFGNAWGSPLWPPRCNSTAGFPWSPAECSQQGSFDYHWKWIGWSACFFLRCFCNRVLLFAWRMASLLWRGLPTGTRSNVWRRCCCWRQIPAWKIRSVLKISATWLCRQWLLLFV